MIGFHSSCLYGIHIPYTAERWDILGNTPPEDQKNREILRDLHHETRPNCTRTLVGFPNWHVSGCQEQVGWGTRIQGLNFFLWASQEEKLTLPKPNICEIASETNTYQWFKFESFPSKCSISVENYFYSWRERERSVLRSCGHVWIVQLTHTRALHSSGAQHSTVTATSPCFWFNFDCFSFISILLLLVCIMSPVLRRHGNCIEANLLLLCCMVLTPWGHSVLVGDQDQETNRK